MDSGNKNAGGMSVSDAVSTMLRGLPEPVQEFVTGPKRAQVAIELSIKHALHVDQAGEFERAYILMLLGVMSPEDFTNTLLDAGISKETVTALIKDVNEQVFVPLREAERNGPSQVTTPVAIPVAPAQREPVVPLFAPIPQPTPAPVTQVTLPGSTEPVPQTLPVTAFAPSATYSAPVGAEFVPQQYAPQMQQTPYPAQVPIMNPGMYPMPPYGNSYAPPMYGWPMQMPQVQPMMWPGMPQQYAPQPVAQSTPALAPLPIPAPVQTPAPITNIEQVAVRLQAPTSAPLTPAIPTSWTPPVFLLNTPAEQLPPRSHGSDPYREPVL